jgi:hypothetical protein
LRITGSAGSGNARYNGFVEGERRRDRSWENLGAFGKIVSGATAVIAAVTIVVYLVWFIGSGNEVVRSSPTHEPWNVIWADLLQACGVNLVLSIVVIWRYDRRRGLFALLASLGVGVLTFLFAAYGVV